MILADAVNIQKMTHQIDIGFFAFYKDEYLSLSVNRGFDLEGDVLIPSMVASTVSYMTFACVFGWDPVFYTPQEFFDSPIKFVCYTLLAFIIAAAVRFGIMFFRQTEIAFRKLRWKPWAKPLTGGLIVGVIGLFFPQILSSGYGYIQQTLQSNQAVWDSPYFGPHLIILLLTLGVLKAIATSFSVGSGGSGGMLGPALFSGAMYGAGIGALFDWLFPDLQICIALEGKSVKGHLALGGNVGRATWFVIDKSRHNRFALIACAECIGLGDIVGIVGADTRLGTVQSVGAKVDVEGLIFLGKEVYLRHAVHYGIAIVGETAADVGTDGEIILLALDLYLHNRYALAVQTEHRVFTLQLQAALQGQCAAEEGIALLLQIAGLYRLFRCSEHKCPFIPYRIPFQFRKGAFRAHTEIAQQIERFDLHIVGQLIQLAFKDHGVSSVLIKLLRLAKAAFQRDHIFSCF